MFIPDPQNCLNDIMIECSPPTVKARVRFPAETCWSWDLKFKTKMTLVTSLHSTRSCLFNVRSSIISQKVGFSVLIFSLFFIQFYVGSGSKSGSGTVMHSGSAEAINYSSGFTTLRI
jgi:hypothetical protein